MSAEGHKDETKDEDPCGFCAWVCAWGQEAFIDTHSVWVSALKITMITVRKGCDCSTEHKDRCKHIHTILNEQRSYSGGQADASSTWLDNVGMTTLAESFLNVSLARMHTHTLSLRPSSYSLPICSRSTLTCSQYFQLLGCWEDRDTSWWTFVQGNRTRLHNISLQR